MLLSVILVIMLIGSFVAADYFGLLGLREKTTSDFFTFRVQTIDAETGQRVDGVIVHCFQRARQNACTQTATGRHGEINVMLPLEQIVLESLLFRHSEVFVLPSDTGLRVMYIHPNYQRLTEYYDIGDLLEQPGMIYTVELQSGSAG